MGVEEGPDQQLAEYVSIEAQSELPRPLIPWDQTSDVHRGSTLIT